MRGSAKGDRRLAGQRHVGVAGIDSGIDAEHGAIQGPGRLHDGPFDITPVP